METLKKQILAAVLALFSITAFSQNEAAIQKAFKESYTQEYNKTYGDAITALNKVYEEKSYELNLRLGWLHYLNKNYTQSQNYYQKAADLKPYAVEAKLGLVKPMAALESWDRVLQTYEDVLKVDGQNYTANYWAGVMQYNRKKYEQAAKYFEKIVNLYPFDYQSVVMLAWTNYRLGKTREAKILFNKALLYYPDDPSAKEGLGLLK